MCRSWVRWPEEQEVAETQEGLQGVLETADLGHSTKERGDKGGKEDEGNERRDVELGDIAFFTPHPEV